jgi:hypothetical protein
MGLSRHSLVSAAVTTDCRFAFNNQNLSKPKAQKTLMAERKVTEAEVLSE